jgi:diguanylate cyclase (GGDEF)-like protein/PAS domain S-box-containing protein
LGNIPFSVLMKGTSCVFVPVVSLTLKEKQGAEMNSKNLSIKSIGVLLFIVLIAACTGIVGFFIFSGWFSSTGETTAHLAEEVNTRIFGRIEEYMNIPAHILEVYKDQIEKGVIDMGNEAQRERFFASVLLTHTEGLYSFSFGSEEGEYYGARRNPQNEIEIMRNDRSTGGASWYYSLSENYNAGELAVKAGIFDPRTRDWYRTAKGLGKTAFSPVYKHFIMPDLTVSAAAPITESGGKLLGVLGAHITLSRINSSLEEIAGEENGMAVIVEKGSGFLIGNSLGLPNFETLPDGTVRRLTLADGINGMLLQAVKIHETEGKETVRVRNDRGPYIVHFNGFHREGIDWLVLFALPENIFTAGIFRNMGFSLLLAVLAVILAAILCSKAANVLMGPMEDLVLAAESLSSGDLSRRAEVRRNDEIGRVAKALNGMAEKLQALFSSLEEIVKERTAELEERNRELVHNREHLKLILDSAAEGIFGIDRHGNCTFANESCLNMLGYGSFQDLAGKNMHFLIHYASSDGSLMDEKECKIFKSLRAGRGTSVEDEVFWRSDGTHLDVAYSSYPQFRNGEIVGAVITFTDNTERRKNQARINYMTYHDNLTGLYNRTFFEEELKRLDREENFPLAIIFGDLNGLKLTNDVFGHTAGDELLKKSAEALKKACRKDDVIARVGGDEFTIILPRTTPEIAEKICGRIREEFSKVRVNAIKASIAVGYAVKDAPGEPAEETVKDAEEAMYKRKSLTRKAVGSEMIDTIMDTLHEKNPREKRHSESMSRICQEIGRAMKMSETEIRKLKDAGYLHDIGKIILDEDILNKGDELQLLERYLDREMAQHPVAGFRILNLFEDTLDLDEGAFTHHENWDGSGYPRGIKGEEIPLMGRILRGAETYDGILISLEKGVLAREEALEKIREQRGTSLDPGIADILVSMAMNAEENQA